MKKLLGIVVLGLLLMSSSSFAMSEGEIKNQLSKRALEKIEGIWSRSTKDGSGRFAMIKSGSSVEMIALQTGTLWSYGQRAATLSGSSNNYFGRLFSNYRGGITANMELTLFGTDRMSEINSSKWGVINISWNRVWPSDIDSHNAKFEKKEEPKDKFIPSSGTAFFVTNKGHLVTNYHVVEGCKNKSKISFKDKEIKVKLLAKDKYLDLALLKADIKNKNFIKISNKAPKKLQRIIAAGYPLGKELSDDLKFTSGIVSSLKGLEDDSTRIQIDAALNPGNSGGPIVDEKNGELVAVAVSGLTKTQSINFGIKAGSVKNFLESNQITSLSQSNYSFGSVDLSAILENATVYTFCK